MHELDPDVVRWGLHLLDVCSLANDGSSEIVTCYQSDSSRLVTVEEGFCSPIHSIVENDEVIAHSLQEELSRLAAAEASELAYAGEEHQYVSGFSPNLHVESDDQGILPEIEDESAIDGELGKRLNQMVPVPHVPKINGEIPSADEATSDHERLLTSFVHYQIKYTERQSTTNLREIKLLTRTGEWGDHVTLQAAADSFGNKIFILTSFKDTCYIEILPQTRKSKRIIFLSFWAEVHYNSIYPSQELPLIESKKKKRWCWS